ncbi:Cytochrome c oxidase assembly factor 7 [Daphnia magna]|uniref:Cytochrome c oxidase assembly factor 7 n=1 Tax=Daphnia magna TaxID=35525 RepID=A0A0P5Y7Z3_9CRUS|nr:Cytochrome c oxidase assembly factor 7 [Daphnia magna]
MAMNLKEEATKLETQLETSCFQLKLSEECHLLGKFLQVVKSNNSRAAAVYRSNCKDGRHADSCYQLGQLYHSDVQLANHRAAFASNRRGCQLGSAKCCLDAGMAKLSDPQDDGCVGQDFPQAVGYLKRACQLGSGFACYLLAGVYITGIPGLVDRDLSLAFKYDFEACKQLDFPLACANLNGALSNAGATPAPSIGVLWRIAHFKSLYGVTSSESK